MYFGWLEKLMRSNKENYKKFIEYAKNMIKHPNIDSKFKDYNVGINNGELAGRTVHHLHIHIIPRYEGDVDDPIGGIRHMFPNDGNYLK